MTNKTNPDYYSKYNRKGIYHTFTPMEALDEFGFILGNVGKYLLRYEDKGHSEDLEKALTYLNMWDYKDNPKSHIIGDLDIKGYIKYLGTEQPLITFLARASEANTYETKAFLLNILKERIEELIEVEPENEENAPIQFCKINNEFLAYCNDLFNSEVCRKLFKEAHRDYEDYKKNAMTMYNLLKDGVDPESKEYREVAESAFTFLYVSWLSTYMTALITTQTVDPSNQLAILIAVSKAENGIFDFNVVDSGIDFFTELFEDNPTLDNKSEFTKLLVDHQKLFTENKLLELSELLEMNTIDEE